jgi:protein ImuA
VDTGYADLSKQLVGGGWPTGCLVDLLVKQPGIREMQLLAPALKQVENKSIMMIEPPHTPQILGLASLGLSPDRVIWIKSKVTADQLWAAEQILKSGGVGALLFWTKHVRPESLRRLHLAAQSSETLFFVLRPLASAQDVSPAPLRVSLYPAAGGIDLKFIKRRGPQSDDTLFLALKSPANLARKPRPAEVSTMPVRELRPEPVLQPEPSRSLVPS